MPPPPPPEHLARVDDWEIIIIIFLATDFPHDHARSRAFRWGEDGIAGVCDTHGFQNIAFSFWNEEECVIFLDTTGNDLASDTLCVVTFSKNVFSASPILKATTARV